MLTPLVVIGEPVCAHRLNDARRACNNGDMATATPTDGGRYLVPTRVDIHHEVDGVRHPGTARYCHTCNPEPNARPHVVPAARRGDYVAPVMVTELTTREALTALTDAGPYTAPAADVAPLAHPARGTRVLFRRGAKSWHAGVVETTTVGAGAPRVAYVHPSDLETARRESYPVNVQRVRPTALYPYPEA